MWTKEDALDIFPEARQALEGGTQWEHLPETAEVGDEDVYYCDDCNRWHMQFLVGGLEVRDGRIYHTLHTVDDSGDWEFQDEHDIEDAEYPRWYEENFGQESIQEQWKGYYEHVAQTADDHLHIFTVPTTRKSVFKVFLNGGLPGVYMRKARDRAGHGTTYSHLNWKHWPQSLKDYFMLKDVSGIGVGPFKIDAPEIKTLDDVRREAGDSIKWTSRSKYPLVVANGLITLDVPIATRYIEAALKRAARAALKEQASTN